MTRLLHPPELERQRKRDQFDPVREGDRYGLSRELSLAIWERVCADATNSAGRRDEEQARQRFHELAERIAERGGRLRPDPGRVTRVGVELNGESLGTWAADELIPRVPGRQTLVAIDARRWAKRDMPTAHDASTWLAGKASGLVSRKVDEEITRRELLGASEVAQAMAALQAPSQPDQATPAPINPAPPRSDWLTAHPLLLGDATNPSVPGRRAEISLPTSLRPSLDEYRVLGLNDMLQRIGPNHRLRQELVAATANPVRSIAGTMPWWEPPPSSPMTNGHALWHAAERHTATLYRRAVSSGVVDQHDPAVESALQQRGTGQPLPIGLRREMERELGVSLTGVRIHTDAVATQGARALNAEAFTLGEDIFFAEGTFAPDTRSGRKLLAHELTHVAQALRGDTRPTGDGLRVSQPGEPLEQEANEVAAHLNETELNEKTVLEHDGNKIGTGAVPKIETNYRVENTYSVSRNTIFRQDASATVSLVAEVKKALANNDVAAVFRLLRDTTSVSQEERQAIVTLLEGAGKTISDDDKWLAERLLDGNIFDSTAVPSDESKMFTDPDPDPGEKLIQTEVHYIAGRSNRRALVIGGVHGSEPEGTVVVQHLIEALKKATRKPFFTVVLVPKLIDKSRQVQHPGSPNSYRYIDDKTAKGSASKETKAEDNTEVEPNRNLQLARKSYATYKKEGYLTFWDPKKETVRKPHDVIKPAKPAKDGKPAEKEDRSKAVASEHMLPENRVLVHLIERFQPERLASIHQHKLPGYRGNGPGVFVDPRRPANKLSADDGFKNDRALTPEGQQDDKLAVAMRDAVQQGAEAANLREKNSDPLSGNDVPLPGEKAKRENPPTVHYATEEHAEGNSLGDWAPVEVKEGGAGDRPAIGTFTIELPRYDEDKDKDKDKAKKAHADALAKLEVIEVDMLLNIFLEEPNKVIH